MKSLITALAVTFLLGTFADAQQRQIQLKVGDVDLGRFEVDTQKTPIFEAGGVKDKNVPNPRDWLEIEIEFTVDGPADAVVPELQFRFYAGFKDQNGQGRTLTGDVRYKNVVCGEQYFATRYVSPNTLGEITGDFRRFQANAVEAAGVEVYYNGVIVGGESTMSGSSAKFWEVTGTTPGLLSKDKTPFALLWIDRYPDIANDGR
ncbi:MAG: Amuc_1102 family pilus-like protein [Verrucomicrobiota bacterium]